MLLKHQNIESGKILSKKQILFMPYNIVVLTCAFL